MGMRSFLRWLKLVLVVSSVMPMVILVCSGFEQGGWPFSGLVLTATALAALAGLVLLIAMAPRALIAVAPILAALALVPIVLNTFQIEADYFSRLSLPEAALLVGTALIWCANLFIWLDRAGERVAAAAEAQAAWLDGLSGRRADWAIFVSAALSLFLELAIIRWQSAVFPLFAFYKNFSLLSCFVGLGLGYALASRRRIPLAFVIPLLGAQMFFSIGLKYGLPSEHWRIMMSSPIFERLAMGMLNARPTNWTNVAIYSLLSTMFLLTSLAFIPVGQLCGRAMQRRENLRAYGLNLLGSIAGVGLMHALSYFWTPPLVWFAAGFAALVAFQAYHSRSILLAAGSSLAALTILAWPVNPSIEEIYSPYQLIERGQSAMGFMAIRASGHYYQRVHDLSEANTSRETLPGLRQARAHYELPYRLRPGAKAVAVVGAGTGNDVAAGLRMGAERIDAVEIDPAIVELGRAYHPERPYDDPKVHVHVTDARTFLRTTQETYDLIVYGLLDSHSVLSHTSSVRLDSFVYTVEGLSEARARLNEDGVLSLSFSILSPDMARKIYLMLKMAFEGRPPLTVYIGYDGSTIFMQRKNRDLVISKELSEEFRILDTPPSPALPGREVDPSTDDWPFFYMPRRVYPLSYQAMLALILVLSLVLIRNFMGESPRFSHATFFFLGAGFMLVETKGITELGLAFGNTWQVVGIVIAAILTMSFLANWAVLRLGVRGYRLPFALLLASLVVGYIASRGGGFAPTAGGRLATVALLTLPVLFSGIVFSTLLRGCGDVSAAMAANLLGAMCGGLLEYNSMYFGFRFLYILAFAVYLAGLVAVLIRPPASARA